MPHKRASAGRTIGRILRWCEERDQGVPRGPGGPPPMGRSKLAAIGTSDFDVVEAGGAGSVASAHVLLGLALAAVGDTPQSPMFGTCDCRASVPEFGRDAAIA